MATGPGATDSALAIPPCQFYTTLLHMTPCGVLPSAASLLGGLEEHDVTPAWTT